MKIKVTPEERSILVGAMNMLSDAAAEMVTDPACSVQEKADNQQYSAACEALLTKIRKA